jgi:hypothetical protein
MKVRIIRTVGNRARLLHSGTVIEVRRLPQITFTPAYQVTEEGPHAGLEIPYESRFVLPDEKTFTEQQYTEIHQELLQKREEVAGLMDTNRNITKSLDAAHESYSRIFKKLASANTSISRMAVELHNERAEKAMALQIIENEAMAQKPVVLPQEVAEAIEKAWNVVLRHQKNSVKHMAMSNWDLLFRRCEDSWGIIHDFAKDHPIEYMTALVNDYTVEQTPEEQFDKGVRDICESWAVKQDAQPVDLAVKVVQLARSVWADKK